MSVKTSFVDAVLSEQFCGWKCYCYIDGKPVQSIPFRDKEDAESFSEEWNSGIMQNDE